MKVSKVNLMHLPLLLSTECTDQERLIILIVC
jgi:hypothetical protein